MPPPPKKPALATLTVSSPPSSAATPKTVVIDAGDLALLRYSGARSGPYDTYATMRGPYRNYSYGYASWGWPFFWGFPFFGTTFIGHVGHGDHRHHHQNQQHIQSHAPDRPMRMNAGA